MTHKTKSSCIFLYLVLSFISSQANSENTKIISKNNITNSQNYVTQGAIAGAIISIPVWLGLVIKDKLFGVLLKGGPEFHGLAGLPVVTAASAIIFAALGNIYKIQFLTAFQDLLEGRD